MPRRPSRHRYPQYRTLRDGHLGDIDQDADARLVGGAQLVKGQAVFKGLVFDECRNLSIPPEQVGCRNEWTYQLAFARIYSYVASSIL